MLDRDLSEHRFPPDFMFALTHHPTKVSLQNLKRGFNLWIKRRWLTFPFRTKFKLEIPTMKSLLFVAMGCMLGFLNIQSAAQTSTAEKMDWKIFLTERAWGTHPWAETCPEYRFNPNGTYQYMESRAGDDPNTQVPFYFQQNGKWDVEGDTLILTKLHNETYIANQEEEQLTQKNQTNKTVKQDIVPSMQVKIKLKIITDDVPYYGKFRGIKLENDQTYFQRPN
jgi:hypothetical protein